MHDRRVVRMERLNDHPAFVGIPPRPTGDLDEQAEGPLLRPEIGNVHPAVRQNDADQFDVGEVQPLGDHLRSQKDVRLAVPEALQHRLNMAFLLGGIGIQPLETGEGEEALHLLLHHLGSIPAVAHIEGMAGRTACDRVPGIAAVVADKPSFVLMVRQGDIAVGAAQLEPAAPAVEEVGEPPAVEKQDHLLLRCQGFLHQPGEMSTDRPLLPEKIHHLDLRHRPAGDPLRQKERSYRTGLVHQMVRLQRGGGAAHDQAGPLLPDPVLGDLAGVVAGGAPAFVAVLVLLVDDDEAEVFNRSEDRAPGPDHEVHFTVEDSSPLLQPLAGGEGGVEDRYPV